MRMMGFTDHCKDRWYFCKMLELQKKGVYNSAKKVASAAKVVGSAAWKGIKNAGSSIWNAVKEKSRRLIYS